MIALFGWNWLTSDPPERTQTVNTTEFNAAEFDSDSFDHSCGPGDYRNVDGDCISGPVHADRPPPGATARCSDGTCSFSQHRQRTCSYHGGVSSWL